MKKIILFILFLLSLNTFAQIQPNNLCASAPTLTVGISCTNNTFSMPNSFTNSGGYPNTGCNISVQDDGWYKFQATSIVTEITIDATEDIIIHVYSGTCGSFTLLGCADNQTTVAEILNIPTTVGTWYYIRIQRYNSSNGITNGTICLYAASNCNWTLCLSSTNSGWYGAYLSVYVNSVFIGNTGTFTGTGPYCYYLPANMGDSVSLIFTGGTRDNRCSYTLYDDLNNLVYSDAPSPGNYSYFHTCNGSLPIELGDFNMTCNGNTRHGTFTTMSEHNVAYFEIQSSTDMMFWNNVETIYAVGNSSTSHDYTWIDNENYGTQPTVYYQMIEYDNDGYSKIFGIYSSTCALTDIVEVYPNPVNVGDPIFVTNSKNIEVVYIIGRQATCAFKDGAIYGLASGIYLITIDSRKKFKIIVK